MSKLKVCKFGGSSLASAEQVKKVLSIVRADEGRRVVVVSAPGARFSGDTKVTDLLIKAAGASKKDRAPLVDEIAGRYAAIGEAWGIGQEVDAWVRKDLVARLDSKTGLTAAEHLDLVKSAGEDYSARLFAQVATKDGMPSTYLSPKKAGLTLTDEPGNAQVMPKAYPKMKKNLEQALAKSRVIFPGFFGHAPSGKVITFGRGGSDISGSVVARALEAPLYENWTDVDFIFSANPKVVSKPAAIQEITFQEMRELAYAGFGVLHDEALLPLTGGVTTVQLRNTNNPKGKGTSIVPKRKFDVARPVVGIAGMGGAFSNFLVEKVLMNREVGFGRRLLQVFEEEGLSFEHMPSGIDSVSVILKSSQLTPALTKRLVNRLTTELKADHVTVSENISLVVLAGLGMRHTVGLAARATAALAKAKVNLLMINQGASEISLMFGINRTDENKAIQALHDEFFGP